MRRWSGRVTGREGFTLVELVLVVTIIAILAGAVVLQASNTAKHARRVRAVQDISTLESAVDIYAIHNGASPTTQQGLAALWQKPTGAPAAINWNGPYVKKKITKDPWGNDYIYRCPAQENPDQKGYDLICLGADGQPGGDDDNADITNFDEQ